jgi:hypothetical protein
MIGRGWRIRLLAVLAAAAAVLALAAIASAQTSPVIGSVEAGTERTFTLPVPVFEEEIPEDSLITDALYGHTSGYTYGSCQAANAEIVVLSGADSEGRVITVSPHENEPAGSFDVRYFARAPRDVTYHHPRIRAGIYNDNPAGQLTWQATCYQRARVTVMVTTARRWLTPQTDEDRRGAQWYGPSEPASSPSCWYVVTYKDVNEGVEGADEDWQYRGQTDCFTRGELQAYGLERHECGANPDGRCLQPEGWTRN